MEISAEEATELRKMATRILEILGPEPEPEAPFTHECRCCGHKFTYYPLGDNCKCGAYMYDYRCIEL